MREWLKSQLQHQSKHVCRHGLLYWCIRRCEPSATLCTIVISTEQLSSQMLRNWEDGEAIARGLLVHCWRGCY